MVSFTGRPQNGYHAHAFPLYYSGQSIAKNTFTNQQCIKVCSSSASSFAGLNLDIYRCCRSFSTFPILRATEASTSGTPSSSAPPSSASPKVSQIVDQISSLSLLEASELVQALKVGFLNRLLNPKADGCMLPTDETKHL